MAATWTRQVWHYAGAGLWCCLSAFSPSAASAETTIVDDDASSIAYVGAWSSETAVLARSGSFHSSSTAGASASLEFFGDFVRVIATTGPNNGRAQLRLCSQERSECESAEIDEHSKTSQDDQVVFARYDLPVASYRIEILLPDAVSGTVNVDAIAYGTSLRGTHYIDNRSERCSNTGSASSADAPWCDFSNLSGETLAPGSELLLARGGVWNQQLGKLYGEGTADKWISIDAYGDGAAPSIRRSRQATDRALWLDNPSYWSVRNLEISNAAAGLVAYFTTNGHAGLRLEHLSTHDNDVVHYRTPDAWVPAVDLPGMYHGAAIFITGNVPVTETAAAISDIEISDIESARDSDPLDIAGFNPSPGRLNFLSTDLGHHAVRDVRIHNVTFHDAKGAPNFDNVERFSLFSSRLARMCTEHQEIGTTSMFFWSAADVNITNNVISDIPFTNSPDGTGTDLESVSSRVQFKGNWFVNNVGAGIEVLAARGQGDFQRDHELAGNVFFQNGLSAGLFTIDDANIGDGIGQVVYAGSWESNGEAHRTAGAQSSSYTIRFQGSQIELYGTRGPDYGRTAVSICRDADDVCSEESTFDAFSNERASGQLLWRSPQLSNGAYKLKARPSGAADLDAAIAWNPAFFSGAPQEASIFILNQTGRADTVTARAHDNLYFEPGGLVTSEPRGNYVWDLSHNISVSARSLFDARADPAGTSRATLRNEIYDGTRYRTLATAEVDDASEQDALASAFDMRPPACATCSVSRLWTAPYAGTVSIRGHAMKNALGGDGVALRVTKNGEQIWPSAPGWRALDGNSREDIPTYVDGVAIAQGDALRFEVAAGSGGDNRNDLLSWSPTVAYVERKQSLLQVVQDTAVGSGTNQVSYSDAHWTERNGTHEAHAANAALNIAFDGTQVRVHGPRGPEGGVAIFTLCTSNADRCLDEAQVELLDKEERSDQVIWTSPLVPIGSYVLRMRVGAAPSGRGDRVSFDYATISADTLFINDDNEGQGLNQVEYRGAGWMQTGNIHYHEGTSADVAYLVRFYGEQVTLTGGKNVDRGIVAVAVCDRNGESCGPESLVDAYAPSLQVKQMLWTSPLLPLGEHGIKVRPTLTRNSAASGSIIDLDRAIVD